MGKSLNIVGQKFGKLIVLEQRKRESNQTKRLCQCDCGNQTWVETARLKSGHTKSCGCYHKEYRKLSPGRAVRNQLLDDYKRGASKRNLSWSLTEEKFDNLISGNCYFCDRKPSTTRIARRFNGNLTYNGIDRLDNTIGYLNNNVVTCCKICNRAKNSLTLKEFQNWIKELCQAQTKKEINQSHS